MSKVYLVSSGSYSDYSVSAVFSSVEKAQAWVDRWKELHSWREGDDGTLIPGYGGDGYCVETDGIELDPTVGPETGRGAWTTGAEYVSATGDFPPMWLIGTPNRQRRVEVYWDDDATVGPPVIKPVKHERIPTWTITATGETPEHAHRSMREILRAIKAGTFVLREPESV